MIKLTENRENLRGIIPCSTKLLRGSRSCKRWPKSKNRQQSLDIAILMKSLPLNIQMCIL